MQPLAKVNPTQVRNQTGVQHIKNGTTNVVTPIQKARRVRSPKVKCCKPVSIYNLQAPEVTSQTLVLRHWGKAAIDSASNIDRSVQSWLIQTGMALETDPTGEHMPQGNEDKGKGRLGALTATNK